MFLKQEKSEIDEFERKKTPDTLAKFSQNIFPYSFVSDRFKIFILKKNLHFLAARWEGEVGLPNRNRLLRMQVFLLP